MSLGKPERNVYDPGSMLLIEGESAPLKHLQHSYVLRQDLRDQFADPGFAGNGDQMNTSRRVRLVFDLLAQELTNI